METHAKPNSHVSESNRQSGAHKFTFLSGYQLMMHRSQFAGIIFE